MAFGATVPRTARPHSGSNFQLHGQKYIALAIHVLFTLNILCMVRLAIISIFVVNEISDPMFKTINFHHHIYIYLTHLVYLIRWLACG